MNYFAGKQTSLPSVGTHRFNITRHGNNYKLVFNNASKLSPDAKGGILKRT